MKIINPAEHPAIEQPDFLAVIEPPEQKPELAPDFTAGSLKSGDSYICPECENTSEGCAFCHGRNYHGEGH